jgi:hypothetical protein
MPHFENIDQYESTNPKRGKQRIIPIAPHSLQASDYRPRKRAHAPERKSEKVPAFPDVEVEPISVHQMEREFRMTNRKLNRRSKRHSWKSRKRGLLQWLKGLFGKKKTESPKGGRKRKPRPDRKRGGGSDSRTEKKAGPPGDGSGKPRRRRRNRTRGKPQGQGKAKGQDSQNRESGNQPSSQERKSKHGGKKRNRRNRNRRPQGGKGNNQGSGHSG